MIHILTILESAVANIISHYICKWLDRLDKDRKPDKMESPLGAATPWGLFFFSETNGTFSQSHL